MGPTHPSPQRSSLSVMASLSWKSHMCTVTLSWTFSRSRDTCTPSHPTPLNGFSPSGNSDSVSNILCQTTHQPRVPDGRTGDNGSSPPQCFLLGSVLRALSVGGFSAEECHLTSVFTGSCIGNRLWGVQAEAERPKERFLQQSELEMIMAPSRTVGIGVVVVVGGGGGGVGVVVLGSDQIWIYFRKEEFVDGLDVGFEKKNVRLVRARCGLNNWTRSSRYGR